jgi:predicted transcriptional regulator
MKNLIAEMKRFGVTIADIQRLLDVSERTVRNKLSGDSDFTYPEAVKIRDSYFPSLRLEYLFG